MNIKKRTLLQGLTTLSVAAASAVYYLYINDLMDFKLLSVGDMNPYGGWSALKSALTDLSYRWRGINKSIALSLAILVTSIFMGRFFCGFICPVGAMQDCFKFIGKKLRLKEIKLIKTKYFSLELLKYFVLVTVMVLSILGRGNILSAFSPWLAYLNLFTGFNIQLSSIILFLIILISLFIKRVFCRCLCPLGAFQSLVYAAGPFKLYKTGNCNNCSSCLKDCPVDVTSSDDLIVSPECISCSECTSSSCINGSGTYTYKLFNRKVNNYVLNAVVIFLSIYLMIPLIPTSRKASTFSRMENMQDGIYGGSGIGFGGNMEIEVMIQKSEIEGIKVIKHKETSGYYEEVFKKISGEIEETQNLNTDVISGATSSSRGFINAVKDAVSKSLSYKR